MPCFSPYRLSLLVSQPTVDHPSMTVSDAHAHLDSVPPAPIILITDSPSLILLTFGSLFLLLASLVGITGILLNSRLFLAVYVLLPFHSFVSVGNITYKRARFSLGAKISEE